MIHSVKLGDLPKPPPSEASRQRSLQLVEDFRKAQADLERICAEKGIPVPQMFCHGHDVRLTDVQRDVIFERMTATGDRPKLDAFHKTLRQHGMFKTLAHFDWATDAFLTDWATTNPM